MELGNQEQALANMERALELEPKLAEAIENVYEDLQAQGKISEEGETAILSLQTYTHPDGAFVIDQPEGWESSEDENFVMFASIDGLSTGQLMMVMFGPVENIFEGMEDPTLVGVAKEIAADFWEGTESGYEMIGEEEISENRAYLSTRSEDQSVIMDMYVDHAEDTAFVLILTSPPDADFHQTWAAIVESYTVYPDAVQ